MQSTALLIIDPYNDFLAENRKVWPTVADVAKSVGMLNNLRAISSAVSERGIRVFIVQHHRAEPLEFAGWRNPTPYRVGASKLQDFAKDD